MNFEKSEDVSSPPFFSGHKIHCTTSYERDTVLSGYVGEFNMNSEREMPDLVLVIPYSRLDDGHIQRVVVVRDASKHPPLCYKFPGGRYWRRNEKPLEAAIRELREETGLDLMQAKKLHIYRSFTQVRSIGARSYRVTIVKAEFPAYTLRHLRDESLTLTTHLKRPHELRDGTFLEQHKLWLLKVEQKLHHELFVE